MVKLINMELTETQIKLLKDLMIQSARKGNLANGGIVLEDGKIIASAESLVVSDTDATAHSERILVEKVCKLKHNNFTPGLTLVTVTEPCLMCISACSWAGYKQIAYMIPAKKYIDKIPWMAEITKINKQEIANSFHNPIELIHIDELENEFSKVFEEEMKYLLEKS